jgi:cytochrome P450
LAEPAGPTTAGSDILAPLLGGIFWSVLKEYPPMGSMRDARPERFRPPAPTPRETPLGSIGLLLALARNPLSVWNKVHYEQPIVIGESVIGRMAVVSDPDAVRRVLLDNADNYRKDSLQRRMLAPGPMGGEGLLLAEGDTWRQQRRALSGLFSPRSIDGFAPAMNAASDALVARWARHRDGRTIDVGAEMALFTLDVLERTIFSDGLAESPGRFAREMTRFFEIFGRPDPFDLLGLPDWAPRLTRIGGERPLRFFDEAVSRLLARRRAAPPETWPHDLLSLLLAARDPETGESLPEADVRANVITFIGAGHETTANALTWTLYLLSQDPETRARVEAEVDALPEGEPLTAAALAKLPWTRATLEESMRLYPPVPTMSREAIGADTLVGKPIRPRTRIIISPWLLHRHKLLWEDADAFDPRRFLPERRAAIPRFAYLPFGGGARVCIGMAFAMQEALIALAALVRNFRLEHAPDHAIVPLQRVTLRPKGGMPMLLRRRAGFGADARTAAGNAAAI